MAEMSPAPAHDRGYGSPQSVAGDATIGSRSSEPPRGRPRPICFAIIDRPAE
jgi:hypothetical protein